MIRRLFLSVVVLAVLAAVAAGGGWYWFKEQTVRAGPHGTDAVVLIPPGTSIHTIAGKLTDQGILRSDLIFRLSARLGQADRSLKAGEFRIPARASVTDVLDVLAKGETVARSFTIPEGLTVSETMEIIAGAEGLMGPLPAVPDEGRLLPETYQYRYYDIKAEALRRRAAAGAAPVASAAASAPLTPEQQRRIEANRAEALRRRAAASSSSSQAQSSGVTASPAAAETDSQQTVVDDGE